MNTQKLALPILVGVVVTLAACVPGYDYQAAYACAGPNYEGTCSYPAYAGAVTIGGKSYYSLHYRTIYGMRQYWLNGVWRSADVG